MSSRLLFRVDRRVFEQYPNYMVACVAALGVHPDASPGRLDEYIENAEVRARATYDGVDLKTRAPFAAWRAAFSAAGWSASRFPASVEALHRRIQRGRELPRINGIVDLANSAVLYYAVPVGTHDIGGFRDLHLEVRYARDSDSFVGMSGSNDPPAEGEIVYAVGSDIRTRRWVWRQGKTGLVSSAATDVFFPIDGFSDQTYDAVVAAQNYLAIAAGEELGARVLTAVVTRECPEFSLDPKEPI